jgi:hypothetical protein
VSISEVSFWACVVGGVIVFAILIFGEKSWLSIYKQYPATPASSRRASWSTARMGWARQPLAPAHLTPIFILTEDGLGRLEVDHFPVAKSYKDVQEALASLKGEHDF